MKTNSYNLIIGISAVALIALLFCWNGCNQRRLGRNEVKQSIVDLHTEKEMKLWSDSVSNLVVENYQLKTENKMVNLRNESLLKSLSAYQQHQSIIRNTNVAQIKQESDKIKDSTINVIQIKDKNGLLIDYVNYNNISNSYDSCQIENKILNSTIYSDSLLIISDAKLIQATDSLSRWKDVKCIDDVKSEIKKVRKRTLWICVLAGTNAIKDFLFIDYLIKK
jgi:regulator of replication initiation timing